jgi:hypothetical protein
MRVVQLDLARQCETVETIKQFIHFAHDWGYNAILLYLEGCIKTESFPYRSMEGSYTPNDIREIVAEANKLEIMVIPCVSTLGHAEHFLEHPQLQHLAEALPDGPSKTVFCAGKKELYGFLCKYLKEVAELFPVDYFHIGCDEAWDLGKGLENLAKLEAGHTREDLVIDHILHVRDILNPLGKRIWIWDDMLENASREDLTRLPRDIVMCVWNYDIEKMDIDGMPGHFNNSDRKDWLAIYEKLGFDVLICPAGVENSLRFTNYARRHKVWGGLYTLWEMQNRFLPRELPAVALSGWLWQHLNQEPEITVEKVLKRLLPEADDQLRQVVYAIINANSFSRLLKYPSVPLQTYMQGPLNSGELCELNTLLVYDKFLGERKYDIKSQSGQILDNLHIEVKARILYANLRELVSAVIDPRVTTVEACRLRKLHNKCQDDIRRLIKDQKRLWDSNRNNIKPEIAPQTLEELSEKLSQLVELYTERSDNATNLGMISLRLLAIWDNYGAQNLTIEVCCNGVWNHVTSGVFKPANLLQGNFSLRIPLDSHGIPPEAIRLTVNGYGGLGICYACIILADKNYIPVKISKSWGNVTNTSEVMKDDSFACCLGQYDILSIYENRSEMHQSGIEILLSS